MDRRVFLASGVLLGLSGAASAQPAAPPLTTDARVALGAYRTAVEQHLDGVLRTLKTLAATSDAMSGDWPRIHPPLDVFAANLPTAAAVWFARPDGGYLTAESGRAAGGLSDRDYFPGLMAGADVMGALVISKSTGHRSVVVATPVRRHGKVIGALGASVRVRQVSELIETGARLTKDIVFYALDPKGRTVIHRNPDLMFQYPSDLGDQTLKAAVATMLSREDGQVDYDYAGSHRVAVFQRSPATGWTFVLAVARS
jgi:methyl-accepting chemotaxis protein